MIVTDELEQVQRVLEQVQRVLEQVQRVLEQVAGKTGTCTGSRIEIPEHGSGSKLLFFFCTINKQRINENETNNNNQTMHEI